MSEYVEDDPRVLELMKRVAEKDSDALADFIELRRMQLLAYIDRNLGGHCERRWRRTTCFRKSVSSAFAVWTVWS